MPHHTLIALTFIIIKNSYEVFLWLIKKKKKIKNKNESSVECDYNCSLDFYVCYHTCILGVNIRETNIKMRKQKI